MSRKKIATLVRLHIGLDDEGFIRIQKDTVNPEELKQVFEDELPDWEDAGLIIRYTDYIQKNLATLLENSEKTFNLQDLY